MSYQQPLNFDNLDEVAAGEPVGPGGPSALEERQRTWSSEDLDEIAVGQPSPAERRPSVLERDRTAQINRNLSRGDDYVRGRSGGRKKSRRSTDPAAEPQIQPAELPTPSSSAAQRRRLLDDAEHGDADDESSTAPPAFSQRRPEEYLHEKKRPPDAPRWLQEIYVLSYLVFFSILGTLARLGMQWLTFYPGAPIVTPVVWANFGGSLLMGFLAEDQRLFQEEWFEPTTNNEKRTSGRSNISDFEAMRKAERAKRKKTIPLYIGLATGFCGSFTSFSSFARDAFLALSNSLTTPISHPEAFNAATVSTSSTVGRSGGYSFMAWAAVVITTLALSIGGLMVGAHTALLLEPITPRIPVRLTRRLFDPLVVVLAFGSWLGAIILAIWPPDRPSGPSSRGTWAHEQWRGEVLFALVFAPLGCLLRFYASLKLNGLVAAFPLGTFAVNMLGTAVEGMCYDIQHVGVGIMGRVGGGRVGCQILQGVMDGFCGCLTTVSTFVAEVNGLRRKHGYAYAFTSVLGALCLMVVIMGSVRWTVGWRDPACNTGYPDKIHG